MTKFRSDFRSGVIYVLIAFGMNGTTALISTLILSRSSATTISADAFQLIAITNVITFAFALPLEAVASRYGNRIEFTGTRIKIGLGLVIALLSTGYFLCVNSANVFGVFVIISFSFSVASAQIRASTVSGLGQFRILFTSSAVALISFTTSYTLLEWFELRIQLSVLIASTFANLLFAFNRIGLDRRTQSFIKFAHSRLAATDARSVLELYVSLALVFGIGTFLHNGPLTLAGLPKFQDRLVIEFATVTTFLRIPVAILSVVNSPFRSDVRSKFLSRNHENLLNHLYRTQLVIGACVVPLLIVVPGISMLLLQRTIGKIQFLSLTDLIALFLSESVLILAGLSHIINTFLWRGTILLLPWCLSVACYLALVLRIVDSVQAITFAAVTSSLVLLVSSMFLSHLGLRSTKSSS